MPVMFRMTIFLLATLFFIRFSWRALKNPGSHGFYRFFVFEGILLIVLLNEPYWFNNLFSTQQLFSWALLLTSVCFIVRSLWMLKKKGGHQDRSDMPENHVFENTVHVVDEGIYAYIRHPMYSSLLFLAWGAWLKDTSFYTSVLVGCVSFFLYIASQVEEGENIRFFGERYREYMSRSKKFIPLLY